MAIVMGLDQHRAQIAGEWIDTDTGEIGRARIAPALRDDVRRFFKRFAGQRLEVALEATTGWRFWSRSCAGSARRSIWPSRPRPRRDGATRSAKTDRADARHLRELLMIGRLPESWIAPDHLLDLRARVRLRQYHHGFPQRNGLLTGENRAWLEGLPLPASAREQVAVALRMIAALDAQPAPITRQLRL